MAQIFAKEGGIKADGDLGDIKIEDVTDDDSEETTVSDCDMIATLPRDLLKPTPPPAYSSVSISHSENVQFGNNTFFNGPVTIKQIIQNAERDNPGYEQTEDEKMPDSSPHKDSDNKCVWDVPRFRFRWCIKMSIIAFSVLAIGAICAVLIVIIYNATHNTNNNITLFKDDDINCKLVEGVCLNMNIIKILSILFSIVALCALWYTLYKLAVQNILTKNCCQGCHAHDEHTNYIRVNKEIKISENLFKPAKDDPLLIASDHLRIVSRTNWLAGPVEKPLDALQLPAPWVIITHTDTESCSIQSECVLRVRLIQMFHVESREWYDIGYNFLVGGDGSAYFGRGWDFVGAHTLGYNKYSIGIAFIGTFNTRPPPKQQIEACQKLIKRGVELGKIAKDYKLFGHRQLSSTLSPGDKLYEIIKEWPHFVKNDTDIDQLVPNY